MIWVRGVEYGTASDLARHFKVSTWTVYKWRDPDRWPNPADALTTIRVNGRDYSPTMEAAVIDLGKRDATRGTPRLDTVTAGA